jgi:hypothetical protein
MGAYDGGVQGCGGRQKVRWMMRAREIMSVRDEIYRRNNKNMVRCYGHQFITLQITSSLLQPLNL